MSAQPGDMQILPRMTKRQERAFIVGMALSGALLFGIGLAIGIMWPQIMGRLT